MEPLSQSPQPIHEMVPVLFVLSFVLFAGFLLVGRIVNWLSKRSLLNGASMFFWLLLAFIIGFTIFSFVDDRISLRGHRIIGQATVALVPSLVLAFFMGRRFRKRTRADKILRNEV